MNKARYWIEWLVVSYSYSHVIGIWGGFLSCVLSCLVGVFLSCRICGILVHGAVICLYRVIRILAWGRAVFMFLEYDDGGKGLGEID